MTPPEMILTQPRILELLPHRPPFLFVDEVRFLETEGGVEGRFYIPADNPFINRASDPPVFPPCLVVEALGQAASLCVRREPQSADSGRRPEGYLVRVDRCTIHGPAHPEEVLTLSAKLMARYESLHKFSTVGSVGERIVARAELTLHIER